MTELASLTSQGNNARTTAASSAGTACKSLNLLSPQAFRARLNALYVWGADLAERAIVANQRLENGSLFAHELDDLTDAVRTWRLEIAWLTIEAAREQRRIERESA